MADSLEASRDGFVASITNALNIFLRPSKLRELVDDFLISALTKIAPRGTPLLSRYFEESLSAGNETYDSWTAPTSASSMRLCLPTKANSKRFFGTKRSLIQKKTLNAASKSAKARSAGGPKGSGLSLEHWKVVKHRANLLHVFTMRAKFITEDVGFLTANIKYDDHSAILGGLNRIARNLTKKVVFPRTSMKTLHEMRPANELELAAMSERDRLLWFRDNVWCKSVVMEMLEPYGKLINVEEAWEEDGFAYYLQQICVCSCEWTFQMWKPGLGRLDGQGLPLLSPTETSNVFDEVRKEIVPHFGQLQDRPLDEFPAFNLSVCEV